MLSSILSICILELERKTIIKNIRGYNMSSCKMTSHGSKEYFTYCNDSPILDQNVFSSNQDMDNQTKCDNYYTSLTANPSKTSLLSNSDNYKKNQCIALPHVIICLVVFYSKHICFQIFLPTLSQIFISYLSQVFPFSNISFPSS